MAVTWSTIQNRIYAETGLTTSRAPTTKVDEWIKKAVIEVSKIVEKSGRFFDEFISLSARLTTSVETDGSIKKWPDDAMRVHPIIQVGQVSCRVLLSDGRFPDVPDEFHQPTLENPVVIVDNSSGESDTQKRYIRPKKFSSEQVQIRYLKEPAGSEEFGDQAAQAIVLKASSIGSSELREDKEAGIFDSRLALYLETLGK